MKRNIVVKILVVLLLVSLVVYLDKVRNDEVILTTIRYIVSDLFIKGGEYNLMLGSSSMRRLDPKRYLNCGTWLNRGVGSSTIKDISDYLWLSPLSISPQKILLYAGENDISRGQSVSNSLVAYKSLVLKLLEMYSGVEIHIIAIKPSPKRLRYWNDFAVLNRALKSFSNEIDRVYFYFPQTEYEKYSAVSFVNDGVHLTEDGYNKFTMGFNRSCQVKQL